MRITSADMNFATERQFIAGREVRESLNARVGGQQLQLDRHERVEVVALSKATLHLSADTPQVAQPQLAAVKSQIEAQAPSALEEGGELSFSLAADDETLHKLRMLLIALGKQAQEVETQLNQWRERGALFVPSHPAVAQQATTGLPAEPGNANFLQYHYEATQWSGESLSLTASGKIKSADGREIDFGLELQMLNLQYSHQALAMRVGELKDPLVLNLGGGAVQLDATKPISFDLDADGRRETMASLAGQSAYLALDRNANGYIDDGRELFGALSGDGFADLATFDDDANGFIDEADAVFEQLKLWRPHSDGSQSLIGLKEAGVGAIGLAQVASQFDLLSQQQLAGQVRSTGVFVFESGQVGTLQQIDLLV